MSGWVLTAIKASSSCESRGKGGVPETETGVPWPIEAPAAGSWRTQGPGPSPKPREGACPADTSAAAPSTEFRFLASRTPRECISAVFFLSRQVCGYLLQQLQELPGTRVSVSCLSFLGDETFRKESDLVSLFHCGSSEPGMQQGLRPVRKESLKKYACARSPGSDAHQQRASNIVLKPSLRGIFAKCIHVWLEIFPYWHFSYLAGAYRYTGLLSQKTENIDLFLWAHALFIV